MRAFLFLLLLIPVPLFSAVFTSNSIAQALEEKDALEGTGYELETGDRGYTLYLDGAPIEERSADDGGYTIVSEDREERVDTENGRRTRRIVKEGDSETIYTYFYDGDRLSSVSISTDGSLEKRIIYLDTASGTPAALAGDIEGYITPSYYIYTLDGTVIKAEGESGWTPPASYILQSDGTWRESTVVDGRPVERVYSPTGLLLSTEGSGVMEEFRYSSDGELLSSVERRGGNTDVTRYENGNVKSISHYSGTELASVRTYLDSGDVEEIRYENGSPRARILFDSDGLRIKEVENLT